MASIGMEMVADGGYDAIIERLHMLTDRLADGLRDTGVLVSEPPVRAPHIRSWHFPDGKPDDMIRRLGAAKVFVSRRLGLMCISPHVYNDEAYIDSFVSVLRQATT